MDKETRVYDLLMEIEEILETATKPPFSKKVSVDPADILEILDDIRQILPEEIVAARSIIEQERELAIQAKERAERVLKDAQNKATSLVNENTIINQAKQEAQEMIDDAARTAYDMNMGAYGYVDSLLYDFEGEIIELRKFVNETINNKIDKQFQAVLKQLGNNRDEVKRLADDAHDLFAKGEFPKAPDADFDEEEEE